MKKYILMLMLVVVAIAVSAQKGRVIDLPTGTITDAGTTYVVLPAFTSDDPVTIQASFTQLTGTAAGTATLEGSVDGTNYIALTDYATFLKGYPAASLTITDGSTTSWVVQTNGYYKYRVKSVGTGTQSTEVDVSYIRK
jgi:hypothetical protein